METNKPNKILKRPASNLEGDDDDDDDDDEEGLRNKDLGVYSFYGNDLSNVLKRTKNEDKSLNLNGDQHQHPRT